MQVPDLITANKVALKGTDSIKIGGPGIPAIKLPKDALYD